MLVFATAALSACSGKTYPFGKGQRLMARVITKSPPTIYFAALHGAPRHVSQKLVDQLAHQARLRNMKFSARKTSRTFPLVGYFSATRTSSGTALAYVFDITNPKSGLRHRVSGEQVLPGHMPSDVWLGVRDHHLTRIARTITENISGWYSQQGYRMSQAAVPPPNLRPHRIAARRIITASTASTPVRRATTTTSTQQTYQAGPKPLTANEMVPAIYRQKMNAELAISKRHRPSKPVRLAAAPASVMKVARPNASGASIVTVRPVTGASRQANLALAQSLRAQLIRAGVVVINDPNRELPAITGTVTLAARRGAKRKVHLTWQVYDKAGVRVGTVNQNNQVDEHGLTGNWNGDAKLAAIAASSGIVNLLGQIR